MIHAEEVIRALLLILLLLLIGIRGGDEGDSFFSKDRCLPVKGICALYIVLCHINMRETIFGVNPLLAPFNPGVIYSNGFFFFLSGYGLCSRMLSDERYLKWSNLAKRLFSVLGVTYVVYLIGAVSRDFLSLSEIIKYAFLGGIIRFVRENDQLWFVIELVFLYVLFWLLFRLFNRRHAIAALIGIILIWDLTAYATGRGIVWYISSLCFAEGIIISLNKERIYEVIREVCNYYALLLTGLLAWLVSLILYIILPPFSGIWAYLVAGNVSTVFFQLVMYLLMYKFTVGNRISRFLGIISFEIYLMHILVISMIMKYTDMAVWIVYGSIGITIITAVLVHYMWLYIDNRAVKIIERFRQAL